MYCDECARADQPHSCEYTRRGENLIRFVEEGGIKKSIDKGQKIDKKFQEKENKIMKEKEKELNRRGKEVQRRVKEMEDYEREREERGKKQERAERWSKIKILATLIICPLLIGIMIISGAMGPGYTFQYEVHGHMENAYYADTPDLMIEELEMAKQGMEDLGLTQDMYGAYWPWGKTPDMRMDYQYKHIDAILERAQAIWDWYNTTYLGENITTTEHLGDVYEEKMANVRMFIQDEGWSDDIAHEAYFVNYHLFYYFLPWWMFIVILLSAIYIIWQIHVLDNLF